MKRISRSWNLGSLASTIGFSMGLIACVVFADNALAQASKAKKSKANATASASVGVPLVCSNFRNTSVQGSRLASDPMDFRDRFATMETITGWVEGVRPSTGATERLDMSRARTDRTRNSPPGAVALFGIAPNEPAVARDVISFRIGDYNLKFKGQTLPATGLPIPLTVSASEPWERASNPTPDPLRLTAFNITICGKPSAVVCQRLSTNNADRFAASARVNLANGQARLVSILGSVNVAAVGTVRGVNSQFRAGPLPSGPNFGAEPNSIFGVDSLGGSFVKAGLVQQNFNGQFNYQGGVKALAIGDIVKTGDYLVTLTTWPGGPASIEPTRPSILSNVEICVTR